MDDGVKQRIVGAFVLVALAVIFVPVFFDRERIAPVDRESQIPLAPEFGETVVNIEELEFELENENDQVPQTVQDLKKQEQEAKKQEQKLSPTVVPAKSVTRVTPAPTKAPSSTASAVVQPKNVQVVAATRAPTPVPTPVPTPFPTMPPNNSVPPQDMYVPRDNNSLTAEELAAEPGDQQQVNNNTGGVTEAWVLQVGSFGIETHAKQMRDDLITMGYRSFVRSIETSKGKMTRVFVGPKIDKNRLLEAQKAVEAKYKLKGIIVRFEP